MTNLLERYSPGRKRNSFFEEMPMSENQKSREQTNTEGILNYTYYTDTDGTLIRELLT